MKAAQRFHAHVCLLAGLLLGIGAHALIGGRSWLALAGVLPFAFYWLGRAEVERRPGSGLQGWRDRT